MLILKLNIKIMKFLFLWPLESLNDRMNRAYRLLYLLAMIIVGGSISTYALLRQTWNDFEDINVINESLAAVGDFYGHFFMYYYFNKNINNLRQLINDAESFKEFCGAEVIQRTEEIVHKYTKWAFFYFTTAVCVNIAIPLFFIEDCKKRRISEEYLKHDPCGLSLRNWYPFDASGPILYPTVLILFSYACISIPLRGLAMSMVLIGLLMHELAQIKHCKSLMAKIFEASTIIEMERRLKFCIKYHKATIEYATRINAIFSSMMILHISLTSFVISVICYQIIIIESLYDKIRHTMHISGWILLLFTACYFGQKLIDESLSIALAIYNTRWYNAPAYLQNNIRLIIMRSHEPLTLTAASLGVMSFPTFLSVMKAAYSYMTLIFTMLGDE